MGDDGIPPGVYKSFNKQLITLLTMLFNNVLNTREYPSSWSTGIICPIHKSGPTNDPTNYRGITLLNCMGRIFNAVLKNRLTEWAERTEMLPESQFGFRKNRRTTDCIFILNALIEQAKISKINLFIYFVDFRKAFDSVDHSSLWNRLISLGISQQMLQILQSMYTKAASRIKVSGNQCTVAFPCQKGIRQGCTLSPLLFSLYIGQLQSGGNIGGVLLKDSVINTLMFADDIVLLSTIAEGLRRHLSSLESLCKELKMEVNIAKTKMEEPFYWKGTTQERVEAYKYIGLWITTDGRYGRANQHLANQGKKSSIFLQDYNQKSTISTCFNNTKTI